LKTIYKYPIKVAGTETIEVPESFVPLWVHPQKKFGDLNLETNWFVWGSVKLPVDTQPFKKIKIRIVGTGHVISDPSIHYLNSFMMMGGDLVFHAFQVLE